MPKGLDKLAEGVGEAVEAVPELYDDVLKPTAQESGKLLALIPRTVNAALVPLRKWIANREYNLDETEKLLAEQLKNVSADKIVTPEAYVAVPAIQAISYSMDSKELRELYANLLAKSMNSDTKDSVHPSFVEIIKQLSPTDALVFSLIKKSALRPLIDIFIKSPSSEGSGERIFSKNISWISDFSYEQLAVSFSNLERLNLIKIVDRIYVHKENYQLVTNTPQYMATKSTVQKMLAAPEFAGHTLSEKNKIIEITDLGELFYKICVQ
ncbi:MAG: DUF4393 domain-containing protein [Lachnospiraceae bacterium]|nr:DUF4393 domain-containing protein [Lachnospiraceae bacterium]